MKLILQQDVVKLGREGEVVTVADGYARNYLLPRRLAVPAVGGALKNLQMKHALEERRSEKLRSDADQAAVTLTGKTVTVTAKAGNTERLYGSVTAQDVADAIKTGLNVNIDKRKIQLVDPIKTTGTYTVTVKLHREVSVPISVEVVKASA